MATACNDDWNRLHLGENEEDLEDQLDSRWRTESWDGVQNEKWNFYILFTSPWSSASGSRRLTTSLSHQPYFSLSPLTPDLAVLMTIKVPWIGFHLKFISLFSLLLHPHSSCLPKVTATTADLIFLHGLWARIEREKYFQVCFHFQCNLLSYLSTSWPLPAVDRFTNPAHGTWHANIPKDHLESLQERKFYELQLVYLYRCNASC